MTDKPHTPKTKNTNTKPYQPHRYLFVESTPNPAAKIVGDTDVGAQILAYLVAANKLPQSSVQKLPDQTYGVYSPRENTIRLQDFTSDYWRDAYPNVATHEMVHAAQNAMDKQNGLFASEQFSSAVSKLTTQGPAVALSPLWAEANRYRSSPLEAQAFGVAEHAAPSPQLKKVFPAPPAHLDATAATEFMILLDLAMRDLQAKQKK